MALRGMRALCVGLCLLMATAVRADTLHIGSWDRKTDAMVVVAEAILSQAYAEVGQPVDFQEYPIRRAMVMMLNGELDGNVFRIAALSNEQPSLYRVETPINFTEVRVYAANPMYWPSNWSQLTGLRVVYQRGTLVVERNLPAHCQPVEAGSIVEMFRLLSYGVADVALAVEPALSKPHLLSNAYGIRRSDGVIERIPLHHYLVGKHRETGVRLNTVLKRMASSGEMQAIANKTLKLPE